MPTTRFVLEVFLVPTSDIIMQMDRELMVRLRHAGTVADRERLVIENLRRKEANVVVNDAPIIRFGDPVIVQSQDDANAFYVYVYGSKVCATAGPCDLASAKQIASEIKLDLKALDN